MACGESTSISLGFSNWARKKKQAATESKIRVNANVNLDALTQIVAFAMEPATDVVATGRVHRIVLTGGTLLSFCLVLLFCSHFFLA